MRLNQVGALPNPWFTPQGTTVGLDIGIPYPRASLALSRDQAEETLLIRFEGQLDPHAVARIEAAKDAMTLGGPEVPQEIQLLQRTFKGLLRL